MTPETIAGLDPGIKDVVVLLERYGFQTTDSGDGRTKAPAPDVLPFRHVVIRANQMNLFSVCRMVYALLSQEGYGEGLHVEGTFDAADASTTVIASWT